MFCYRKSTLGSKAESFNLEYVMMVEKTFSDLPSETQKQIWSNLTLTNQDWAKFNALTKTSKDLRVLTLTCTKYTPSFSRNVLEKVVTKGTETS